MTAPLLDVNVLLALGWPNHQHHAAAHRWFQRHGRTGWCTCALTQLAFIRLSSNPAYTAAAVDPRSAAQLLGGFTIHSGHRFLADLPEVTGTALAKAAGHRQVVDAYLVAIAEHHATALVTFDRRAAVHAGHPRRVIVIEPDGDAPG
jgi:toxin-antitoxin system PIN domain toxin